MDAANIDPAISPALPQGLFLMSVAHEDSRSGFITRWVQQCSQVPFLVSVAIPRGTPLEPLLRDSRHFPLSAVHPGDRVIQRRFSDPHSRSVDDPFVGLRCITDATGSPILQRGQFYLDCELTGHLALESDCRIYIGHVLSARVLEPVPALNGHANGHANGHTNGHIHGHTNGLPWDICITQGKTILPWEIAICPGLYVCILLWKKY